MPLIVCSDSVAGSVYDQGVKTAMVVNNQEPDSGGKEGILAIIAIAVVLFFVIRIYSDYVIKTGQAVKPGHEAPEHRSYERSDSLGQEGYAAGHRREKPGKSTYSDDSIADDRVPERPRKPAYADDEIPPQRPDHRKAELTPGNVEGVPHVRDRATAPTPYDDAVVPHARDRALEPTPYDEEIDPVHRHRAPGRARSYEAIVPLRHRRVSGREYARNTAVGRPRYHRSRSPYAGQIVIGHEPYSPYAGDRTYSPHRNYVASKQSPYDEIVPRRVRETSRPPFAGQIVIGHAPQIRPIHKSAPYDDWVSGRPHNHVSRTSYPGQIVIGHAPETRPMRKPAPYDEWAVGRPRKHVSRQSFAGQIVIEHAPDSALEHGYGQTIAHRRSLSGVQKPRLIDEIDQQSSAPDRNDSSATIAGKALFASSTPYPGVFDDVRIGDSLTEIDDLSLPQGHLSHSVYTYCPEYGPFKSVSAMLTGDSAVSRVVYRFRNAKCRAEVRQQAIDAFGEGEIVYNDRGDCRQWRHLNGLTVTIEHDRYCIEKDASTGGAHASRHFGRTIAE